MQQYLLSDDKDLNDNINIYILMNINNHWNHTLKSRVSRLPLFKSFIKDEPSIGWKCQYYRIIRRKFIKGKLI